MGGEETARVQQLQELQLPRVRGLQRHQQRRALRERNKVRWKVLNKNKNKYRTFHNYSRSTMCPLRYFVVWCHTWEFVNVWWVSSSWTVKFLLNYIQLYSVTWRFFYEERFMEVKIKNQFRGKTKCIPRNISLFWRRTALEKFVFKNPCASRQFMVQNVAHAWWKQLGKNI